MIVEGILKFWYDTDTSEIVHVGATITNRCYRLDAEASVQPLIEAAAQWMGKNEHVRRLTAANQRFMDDKFGEDEKK